MRRFEACSRKESARTAHGKDRKLEVRGWMVATPLPPVWGVPPPLFCKCMKRKGFKSFVLKVCDSKGLADAFFAKCVKLKSLGSISASFQLSALCSIPLRGLSGDSPSKQGGLRRTYLAGAWG